MCFMNQKIYTSAVCALFLMTGVCVSSDIDKNNSPPDANDSNGPTVALSYNEKAAPKNPFTSFMYFVPLVSLTDVNVDISPNNDQRVRTVSYERKVSAKSFYVSCEFEMTGRGFHKYVFDPVEVIASHASGAKKGETLDNLIDYIKFEGPGFGQIEVKGTISGSSRTVDEVDLHFNARGHKSPVTLGLYDVSPENGQYKYENRTGELIARVDTFVFKKTVGEPRMGIKLASINAAEKPQGFLAGLKGAIANLFINPPKAAKLGNDTMLDFGLALLNEKSAFTFPKANNIKKVTQEPATGN